jgi:hypothetical protein
MYIHGSELDHIVNNYGKISKFIETRHDNNSTDFYAVCNGFLAVRLVSCVGENAIDWADGFDCDLYGCAEDFTENSEEYHTLTAYKADQVSHLNYCAMGAYKLIEDSGYHYGL